MLNVNFPPAALQTSLNSLIIPAGPGSWKRKAFWDEYVVTLHNSGDQPLQVTSMELVDFSGAHRRAGDDPWKLEKESKSLAKQYQDAGTTIVRVAGPRVLVAATESSGATSAIVGGAGAATTATATAIALPVYGATMLGINLHNKKVITAEFNRRRLRLPLVLAGGETKSGSLFFPMVPNPQSLTVNWSSESGSDSRPSESVLPLEFLHGLHVKGPQAKDATSSRTTGAAH